jgi:hypothetical protein
MKNKHLIIINTYNRIEELNKTIKSINENLPSTDICIISKGRERLKEITGRIKYFHKVENIGREANGYLYGFLKHSKYKIYTFLQDHPSEGKYSYYGDKIKIAESLISSGEADFVSGMQELVTPSRSHIPKKIGLFTFNLNEDFQEISKKRLIWRYPRGACFSTSGENLRSKKKFLLDLFYRSKKEKFFAWEMELAWGALGKKRVFLDSSGRKNVKSKIYLIKEFFLFIYYSLLNMFN